GIAVERLDVHALVKARVNQTLGRLDRVAHKTVLPAFPGGGFRALVVALYILIEGRSVVAEEGVVLRRQAKIERRRIRLAAQAEQRPGKQSEESAELAHAINGASLDQSASSPSSSISGRPRSARTEYR